jgi:hypothetical protein
MIGVETPRGRKLLAEDIASEPLADDDLTIAKSINRG